MLGLKRGTVKLVRHDKKWGSLFEKEKSLLKNKIGNLIVDIQHIGSTSIPNIEAKPILDISIGVRSLKLAKRLVIPMQRLGYELSRRSRNRHELLFTKGPESKRTHYIHVLKYNGAIWKHDLLFRDYLLKHPLRAKQYAALKKKLSRQYANDRFAYTAGKKQFILQTLKRAKNP